MLENPIILTVVIVLVVCILLFIAACVMGHRGGIQPDAKQWRERKRLLFFGLPWTFTVYECDQNRFLVKSGLLMQKEEDIQLYRIMDIGLQRSLLQRMLGLGTIRLSTSDRSAGNMDVINVRAPKKAKEWISDMVERKRDEKRVSAREYMSSELGDDDEQSDG